MILNPHVDCYTKTRNQQKTLCGVLLTAYMVLWLELSPLYYFLCPMVSIK